MSGGFASNHLAEIVADDCNEHVISGIASFINKDSEEANAIFTDMWMYAHGIAAMLVMNKLDMTRDEIKTMITRVFRGFTRHALSGISPERK